MKPNLHDLWPASVSIVAAITANQEQIEWYLRCAASLVALIAGSLAIYRFFRPVRRAPRGQSA